MCGGDILWRDYIFEVEVKSLSPKSIVLNSKGMASKGIVGILFRYQNNRNYYILYFTDGERVKLAKRCEEDFVILASANYPYSSKEYYHLTVEVSGYTISCFINEEEIFNVRDKTYATGKVGFRCDVPARYANVSVSTTKEQRFLKKRECENKLILKR